MSCVSHAFASIHCCHVVTCWESADLLALVCDVLLCFCHFPMWYPVSGVVLDCILIFAAFLTLIGCSIIRLDLIKEANSMNPDHTAPWEQSYLGPYIFGANTQENLSSGVCEQHRRRPACESAQSDQHLCSSLF